VEVSDDTKRIEELEKELAAAKDLAIHLAKLAEMGKMVAVVAHELSQPLLGIKAFAQILRRRYSNDSFIGPKIRMIEEQAVHMEGILDGLRRYSKTPRKGEGIVKPSEPLHTAVELFRDRAKKLRVNINLQIESHLPDVRGNHGHIQQVIVNLISNALDELEGGKGGIILVKAAATPEGVRVQVADTGRGIDEDMRDKIFEPFYTTKGAEKGTGLGLSICRDILELHRGAIRLLAPDEVEKTFGAGFQAAFEVFLAKAPDE
jgi:two-component system NtrC family sensor kinase